MELNWTTFILEIINFLVLVWILKRFFYKPVQEVIARRRAAIAKELSDAKDMRAEAEAIEQQYHSRLDDWEHERETARQNLRREIEAERARLKDGLSAELAQERQKLNILEDRRAEQRQRETEQAAVRQAGRFLAQMLERLAGPELEARILDMVKDEITALPPDRLDALRQAWSTNQAPIVAQSGHTLKAEQRKRLQETFERLLGAGTAVWQFRENPDLIAGLRVNVGAWTLGANLRDELNFFTASSNEFT